MRNTTATLILLLLNLGCTRPNKIWPCRMGQMPVAHPDMPTTVSDMSFYMHSHNDYEHRTPLWTAIWNRFASVEADITLEYGTFAVGHHANDLDGKGRLEDLYLNPLQQRVNDYGSIYPDDPDFKTFYLVLDIKQANPDLPNALMKVLDNYPMLTQYTDDSVTPGPVTIILTGEESMKRAIVESYSRRRASRDSNVWSFDDPPADNRWTAYALRWSDFFDWNGDGEMSADDQQAMLCLVDNTRATGRSLRLWDTPDRASVWEMQAESGVRFINSDSLLSDN
jgi:hypothetical protein